MALPGIAVKAFIVDDEGRLLLIRRSPDDIHAATAWEIPGGRLEPGEDPFLGLKRETREETGLDIEVLEPLQVHHFTRSDGQVITLITFLCEPLSTAISLSEEHDEFQWAPCAGVRSLLHEGFHKDVDAFERRFPRKA